MTLSKSKRRHQFLMIWAATAIALLAVLGAIGAGASSERLWPVAGFLLTAVVSGAFSMLASRAERRRSARMRVTGVPRNVRLKQPLWMRLNWFSLISAIGAVLGAIIASFGFPQVAMGILLVVGGWLGVASFFLNRADLSFEEGGLRVHRGAVLCLIPWSTISGVQAFGPDHYRGVELSIRDPGLVLASITPDVPKARTRMRFVLGWPEGGSAQVLLFPWTGGIDGQSLEQAIREGMACRPDRTN